MSVTADDCVRAGLPCRSSEVLLFSNWLKDGMMLEGYCRRGDYKAYCALLSLDFQSEAPHRPCLALEVLVRLLGWNTKAVPELVTTPRELWGLTSTDWMNTLITVI